MSIHAHLHPDAQRALDDQQRRARASSIIIAILGTILLALIMALLILRPPLIVARPPFFVTAPKRIIDLPEPPTITPFKRPTPSPGGSRNPVLVSLTRSDRSIPAPDLAIPTETDAYGSGKSDGIGAGDGFNPGDPGGPPPGIPPTQRCSKTKRLARLAETGGSPRIDDAVVETLRWLKTTQDPSGSWGQNHKVGMTGFALLAYLGHCETPVSVEFGASCTDAIVYLLDLGMKNNGKLGTNLGAKHWPYEHAIATYALAEALSFARLHGYNIPHHAEITQMAGQWIIDNQHPSGGWDYSYDESSSRGGDLSITGWHLQALKACSLTGLDFRNMRACVRKGLDYTGGRQATNGGFGYSGTQPAGGLGIHSLTGVGVLCHQIWDRGSSHAARKGIRYLTENAPFEYNTTKADLYAHYYTSQAILRYGGPRWESYNRAFASDLMEAQMPDGSFKKPGGGMKPQAVAATFAQDTPEGIHYRNCLCALMLEVYYRYLPGTGK